MDHVAVRVSKNLHFNVSRRAEVPLDEHHPITKRSDSLAGRRHECTGESLFVVDNAHPTTTTAKRGLQKYEYCEDDGVSPVEKVLAVAPTRQ